MVVLVIPLKNGEWRSVMVGPDLSFRPGYVRLSPKMYKLWQIAYRRWWATKGHRLAISPEMWR